MDNGMIFETKNNETTVKAIVTETMGVVINEKSIRMMCLMNDYVTCVML